MKKILFLLGLVTWCGTSSAQVSAGTAKATTLTIVPNSTTLPDTTGNQKKTKLVMATGTGDSESKSMPADKNTSPATSTKKQAMKIEGK